ncbi:monocarboxylate transporter 12-B-like [Limulus polyphemus]|uniref:Monocarboxylate transporter 12-B-like n=1 Tax=Limulus polyphemus TaxID=6850 RepID=A0ABM1C3G3_LIMPO|nr:monocarboxylate transporter 12-B-like [Limulus polyphemus]
MLTINTDSYSISDKPLTPGASRAKYLAKNPSRENAPERHCNARTLSERRKYRSKSVVSSDPRSPYFTSRGAGAFFAGQIRRAPSVSCVEDAHGAANYLGFAAASNERNSGRLRGSQHNLNGQIPGLNLSLSPDNPKAATIHQHYYPEGGWGWMVCGCATIAQLLTVGLLAAYGFFIYQTQKHFRSDVNIIGAVCMGAFSTCVALFLSPVIVAICRRKSTRLLAVLGGLITALGCLFTSFASQFHQLFVSYGIFVGCGVSMTRDAATLMVGQYFKRKRELVEIAIFCGTGLGMTIMPVFLSECIRTAGWRLGLQAVTGVVFITFILGVFYRPASLYHPQRRAILHLKGLQKRSKAKDKQATVEKPPFFDFGVLKSRTVQILLLGTGLAAFGAHTPVILLVYQGEKEGLDYQSLLLLQVFLGLAFALGSGAFGFIIVKNSVQCMIARQYLCQAALFMISASLLAFTALKEYQGFVLFVWIYGLFYGGYSYSLKMYTLEKVRARNFARAWGFVQWIQAIPFAVGIPVTGYINEQYGGKIGFYFSSAFAFVGSVTLFLIDIHKRNVEKRKMSVFSEGRRCSDACLSTRTFSRQSSFQDSAFGRNPPLSRLQQRSLTFSNYTDLRRQELTCISEEVAMENFLEDLVDDCITSCNKEEKYLMLSEYEQNLNKTQEDLEDEEKAEGLRKMSVINSPSLETCPSCLKYVHKPIDGRTDQTSITDSSPRPNRQNLQKAVCNVDIIEEVTTSL